MLHFQCQTWQVYMLKKTGIENWMLVIHEYCVRLACLDFHRFLNIVNSKFVTSRLTLILQS